MVGGMKPLGWTGSAREDLLAFSPEVVREIGHVLYVAQIGGKHSAAKPLKGFGGSSVLEVVEDHAGDTFRAVYTVRFAEVIYVLHAFQKKAKKGVAKPLREMAKVKSRLKQAQEAYEAWQRMKK
jgi:phage-related protein